MRTIVARALPVVLAVGAAGVALALPTALLGDRAGAPRSRPAPAAEAPIVIRLATPPSAPQPRPASPRPVPAATPATVAARTTPPAVVAPPGAPAPAEAVPAPPAAPSRPKAQRLPARPPVPAPAPVPVPAPPAEPVQQVPSATLVAEPEPQPQPEVRSPQSVLPAPPVAEAGIPAGTGADAQAPAKSTPKEHGNVTHRADGTPGNGEHGRGRVRT
jgi:hypothetical protein